MKKLEYIYSPENLIRESKNYRLLKIFQFEYITNKLKSKTSIQDKEKLDFQEKLIEAKKKKNKRVFRGDVVLEMNIYVNQKNAPSIQNIPKCYIDLLWRPVTKFKNKNLILKDDDQIKYLKVTYNKSISDSSSIVIKIFPYHRLLKDIELLFRLERGIFKYDFDKIKRYNHHEDDDERFKENPLFDDLLSHVIEKDTYIKQFDEDGEDGESIFKFWEYFYKREVQKIELNNNRIKNNQILILFKKSIKIKNESTKLDGSIFSNLSVNYLDSLWDRIFTVLGDFDIKNLPTKSGEKAVFKKKLENKVDDYFNKKWFYFPLLNPIALSIFILPPKNNSKDFDNVAKWILPKYMKKLNPPTEFETSLENIEKYRKKKHNEQQPFYPKKGEFPKNGILSYQVIQIPRLEDSPQNGYIKVNFHNENHNSFLTFIINQLDKYEYE